jgi:hypothetical protein
MKFIKNTFFLSIFLLLFYNCTSNGQQNETTKTIQNTESLPLLVVTGYGSDVESITADSLKTLYQNGQVYVLKEIKNQADSLWGNDKSKVIDLKNFIPLSKKHILITDLKHLTNQFKVLAIDSILFFRQPEKYPFYTQGSRKFDFKKQVTKFMLTGVTAITRNTGKMADAHGTDFIIEGVKDYFQDSDFVHISNEVSFYENCDYNYFVPNVYRFCSKERDFEALKKLNTNIIELTGNHNKDFGAEGYQKTYEWYQKNGMKIFGGGLTPEQANTPLIITLKDGKKMAFIGFNESCPCAECAIQPTQSGANKYDREKARKVIQKLKTVDKVDILFASVQFSEVDSYAPTTSQNVISRDLLDFGADVVYGSQAHQVQKIEFYKGKPIFHGLGNFLFDQIHRIGVKQGYFLENYIYNGKVVQSIPIFTMITANRRPEIAQPDEEKEIRKIVFEDGLIYK